MAFSIKKNTFLFFLFLLFKDMKYYEYGIYDNVKTKLLYYTVLFFGGFETLATTFCRVFFISFDNQELLLNCEINHLRYCKHSQYTKLIFHYHNNAYFLYKILKKLILAILNSWALSHG